MTAALLEMPINWTEAVGYLAALLVFATFCMKTLVPLRLFAIGSNVVFIFYALAADIMPVLVLHGALLPLNILRTVQQLRTYRRVRDSAQGTAEVETLVPFMQKHAAQAGNMLFRQNDIATYIYYISSGTVQIPEIGKTLGPGELFGEVGLFTKDQTRTASAICAEPCDLLIISKDDLLQHCINDPAFGVFITKLIASRMSENQTRSLR